MTYDMPMHQGRELPRLRLRQIDLPEILQWDLNGQYYIVLKVEMISKNNRKDIESSEDQGKLEADFQVLSVRALGDRPIDAKAIEREDFDLVVAKARSGGS